MAELMRQHVCLRELAGRAEAAVQLVEKSQVDVHLLIFRAIERARCGLRPTATRLRVIAKQHQLGMVILTMGLFRQEVCPDLLSVVQSERDKLHEGSFECVALRVGTTHCRCGTSAAATEQSKQVGMKYPAQHEQDQ